MTGVVNNNVITAGTNENIQTSEPVRNTNAREEFDILDEEALPPSKYSIVSKHAQKREVSPLYGIKQ